MPGFEGRRAGYTTPTRLRRLVGHAVTQEQVQRYWQTVLQDGKALFQV